MKKRRTQKIVIALFVASFPLLFVGCSSNEEQPKTMEVPQNNEEKGKKNTKEKNGKETEIDTEIGNADLSGGVAEITANGILINENHIVKEDENGEEIAGFINNDDETIQIEFTEKTEFKKYIITNMKDGRLEKGTKNDITTDNCVELYGSYAGSKFIATKVIITILE